MCTKMYVCVPNFDNIPIKLHHCILFSLDFVNLTERQK